MGGKKKRITNRPYGRVQEERTGRKLFARKRQEIFLEHLAATCNVLRSSEAAGVTPQCVYKKRRKDAVFRAGWAEALEQGYARLEAMLLEEATTAKPIAVKGDLELPPEHPSTGLGTGFDKDLALHLLREHKKGLQGQQRPGAEPKPADWSEVEAHFIGRLKALKKRIDRRPPEEPEGVPA